MFIKRYDSSRDEEIHRLFTRSVHESCKGFYTEAELDAWAPEGVDAKLWARGLGNGKTLMAVDNGVLLGFGTVTGECIDKLYVDPDYQGRGIGKLLLSSLEGRNGGEFRVYASKQSRRFFRRQGYKEEMEHYAFIQGQSLLSFLMVKDSRD